MIHNTEDSIEFSRFVNRDNSINLDSSDAFEGPEKLLEVWFAPSPDCLPYGMASNGLRSIPRKELEDILDLVHCKVLSVVSTPHLDSYVLSESSMFVYPHKLLLKTCGTTTLISGIPQLLKTIEKFAGYPQTRQPWRVFYSRKSFLFPERQKHPHRSWQAEVHSLNGMFCNGRAYTVGDLMADHWYLFTTVPSMSYVDFPNAENRSFNDETLEIMMTDLCPKKSQQFSVDRLPGAESLPDHCSALGALPDDNDPGHLLGNAITNLANVDKIYPTKHQVIDSFCFTPCGYSCNGLVTDEDYFTIHVTPEAHCSYASFETSVSPQLLGMKNVDVVHNVLNIFKPGKFSIVYFQSTHAAANDTSLHKGYLSGYKRVEKVSYDLVDYTLNYLTFEAINNSVC